MIFLQKILTSVFLLFHLSGSLPYSQLEKAFNENNASVITSYGKDKFLMKVNGKEGIYSQAQATLVLKDFFESKPASSFTFSFKGKESNEGCFAVGEYKSKTETFKVSLHFQKISDQYKIESLTIEK